MCVNVVHSAAYCLHYGSSTVLFVVFVSVPLDIPLLTYITLHYITE